MRGFLFIGAVGISALLLTAAAIGPAHAAPYGTAVVIGTDGPENCLRVRTGPGLTYPVVGCAGLGSAVRLTGVTANNNWVEISVPVGGWVYGPQVEIRVATYIPPLEYVIPGAVGAYVYGYPYRYRRYGAVYPWWAHKGRYVRAYPYVNRHFGPGISARVGRIGGVHGYRGVHRAAVGFRSSAFVGTRGVGRVRRR